MSELLLVRHGQATWGAEGYAGLSERGRRQAHALGRHWVEAGRRFDRVLRGPRSRHQETEAAVARAYREAGLPWPEATVHPGLDEYDAEEVMATGLPWLVERDPEAARLSEAISSGTADRAAFARIFQRVTRAWAQGELDPAGVPSWPAFRARVAGALQEISALAGRSTAVVAFTSGGVIAAAVGYALGASDLPVVELSWVHRNTAVTELLFAGDRFGLRAYNASAHLVDPELLNGPMDIPREDL